MLEGCTHGQRKLLIEFKNKLAAVICERNDYLHENFKTSVFDWYIKHMVSQNTKPKIILEKIITVLIRTWTVREKEELSYFFF